MDKRKILMVYLGTWGVLLLLSYVTDAASLDPKALILYTGILSLAAPLLYAVSEKVNRKPKTCTLVRGVSSPEVLFRVEGEWICAGSNQIATYYIKKDRVYSFQSKTPLYRLEDRLVYRWGEEEPFLVEKDGKLWANPGGQARYELSEEPISKG